MCRELLRLNPNDADAHYNIGLTWLRQGRFDEAITAFRKAIKINPRFGAAHHNLALALRAQGKFEDAVAVLGRVIELEPWHAVRFNELAWWLVTAPESQQRDPKRAVRLAARAVELSPQAATHWNTLGAAHYRAQEYEQAVTALEKSLALDASSAACDYFFLAKSHWQLGNKDGGRTWYRRAVEWMEKNQPSNRELKRFRA